MHTSASKVKTKLLPPFPGQTLGAFLRCLYLGGILDQANERQSYGTATYGYVSYHQAVPPLRRKLADTPDAKEIRTIKGPLDGEIIDMARGELQNATTVD